MKVLAATSSCLTHQKRGNTVCNNKLVLPIGRVDDAVISKLLKDVLTPVAIRTVIDGVFKALRPNVVTADVNELRKDLRTLDLKITRLLTAIDDGKAQSLIVAQLQTRQTEREALVKAIAAAEALGQLQVDRRAVEQEVLEHVEQWIELLSSTGEHGQVLREALDGQIRFVPVGKQYHFTGKVVTGKLIAGLVNSEFNLCGVPNQTRPPVTPCCPAGLLRDFLEVPGSRLIPLETRFSGIFAS
jgi:chorismate mutase